MNQPFAINTPAYLGTAGIPMAWWGQWADGHEYPRGAVVRDGVFTMISNKERNTDKAAPVPIGVPYYLYEGSDPTEQVTAKILEYAIEYTALRSGFVTGYRLYIITGNHYRISSINEDGEINEVLFFIADSSGWKEFNLSDIPVKVGTTFTIFVQVQEPDPVPLTFSGSWRYSTPNNDTVPLGGEVVQSNKTSSLLRVNTQDIDVDDRYDELSLLTIGDIISSQGVRWAIQQTIDNVTWFDFSVAPAAQAPGSDIQIFEFETVVAKPITFLKDVDYWASTPNIRGYENVDGAGGSYNQNAYGIDILVQEASVSDSWELVSYGGL